ncbi:hypothetical protein DSECCO2_506850 [anaerobic digester metagenome]
MLRHAAVQVGHGVLAVVGELEGHLGDVLFGQAGHVGPLGQRAGEGGFLVDLEHALDLDAVQFRVDKEVARLGPVLAVGVEEHGLAALQDDKGVELPLAFLLGRALLRRLSEVGAAQVHAGRAVVAHLDQPGGLGPGRLVGGLGRALVGVGQIAGVEALVLDDPADHGHAQCAHAIGLDGQPLPGPPRGLGAARIDDGDLAVLVHDALGDLAGAHGRSVVGLVGAGADKEDEFGVARVGLPVELAASRELAFLELVAHGLAREVEGALTDGGVAVGVGRPEVLVEEAQHELAASAFLTAPIVADVVVLGAEVRVLGVDQMLEVVGVLGLELVQRHLLRGHGRGVLGQIRVNRRVAQGRQGRQAFHVPFPEEVSAFDDFADGLVEGDGLPFAFAALAGALQDFDDAVGVVEGLDAGIALGAESPVDVGGFGQGRGVGDLGIEVPGVERVAVELGHPPVHDFCRDAAVGVALLAHGVDLVFGLEEGVGPFALDGQGHGFLVEKGQRASGHARRGGPAQQGAALDEGAAVESRSCRLARDHWHLRHFFLLAGTGRAAGAGRGQSPTGPGRRRTGPSAIHRGAACRSGPGVRG